MRLGVLGRLQLTQHAPIVAGSTMSGKTVFLHAILLSLIARLAPEQASEGLTAALTD